jgi:3',5'-cyclic AMP phosphodiesterase CpdA
MRPQQPVPNRNLSLWQSAVRQTLISRGVDAAERHAVEHAVSIHAQAADAKTGIEDWLRNAAQTVAAENKTPVAPIASDKTLALAQSSAAAFDVAEAHRDDDQAGQVTLFDRLKGLVAKYSSLDLLGWAQCWFRYLEYYVAAHSSPPYRYWDENKPVDISFGTIDWQLEPNSKLLIIGDWGTHMSDNVALLRQALTLKPDAIVHLGDVYYSGTVAECQTNVLDALDALFKGSTRVPFFTIPGNHDYYSGGGGFYRTIDEVNKSLQPTHQQKASYFCLRTKDGNWQFLGMDTGLNDRNPVDQMAPSLEKSEVTWHRDKLDNFTGTTVLFSHHQLFSANSKIADGPRPYLNEALNAVFRPYYDRVAAWFWGHEHNLVIFADDQKFDGGIGLKKGRLVGCSAYEETQAEDPYKVNFNQVAYCKDMPRLNKSPNRSPTQIFYNHAFAMLEITPAEIVAKYYEYPSWDQNTQPNPEPKVGEPIYTEHIPRIRP